MRTPYPGVYYAFENPDFDALCANPVWEPATCTEILPVVTAPTHLQELAPSLVFENLTCGITILQESSARNHILFSEEARHLQLDLHGRLNLCALTLMTPAVSPPERLPARIHSLQRLVDLVRYRTLRPALYPAARRGRRFARVLQALDGWLAGATQREIALAISGENRVTREWSDPRRNLRDQIRRTIGRGRALTTGGYLHLLK